MATYIGLIRKDEGTCYGVDFPDFPDCITAADTLEEATRQASEVLGFHIRCMMKDGDPIPAPSPMGVIVADLENAGSVMIAVVPNMQPKGRSVKANITVEESLLADIDAFAEGRRMTRSAFLADAARKAMASA